MALKLFCSRDDVRDVTQFTLRSQDCIALNVSWLRVAEDHAGSAVRQDGASVARSGIVVAMPASMAQAIGWDTKAPSWSEVLAVSKDPGVWERLGHADWVKFKFGKASPTASTSGLMGLLASYGVAGGNLRTYRMIS